jgi:hypothetical protein
VVEFVEDLIAVRQLGDAVSIERDRSVQREGVEAGHHLGAPATTRVGGVVEVRPSAHLRREGQGLVHVARAAPRPGARRRSDIFSLATLLWEPLTAERLFTRGTSFETMEAITRAEVPPLATYRGDIAPGLDQVLAKAFARKPDDRYANWAEVPDWPRTRSRSSGPGESSQQLREVRVVVRRALTDREDPHPCICLVNGVDQAPGIEAEPSDHHTGRDVEAGGVERVTVCRAGIGRELGDGSADPLSDLAR